MGPGSLAENHWAKAHHHWLNVFSLFFLVKPANPNISICTIKNEGSDNQIIELEVEPPSTWPQPHSYFPLKHQIEYEIRHDGEVRHALHTQTVHQKWNENYIPNLYEFLSSMEKFIIILTLNGEHAVKLQKNTKEKTLDV